MGIQIGLNCPACGGSLDMAEGENVVNCKYCSSTLYIEGDAGVTTIAFKNKIQRTVAEQAKDSWFRKGFKARDLPRSAKLLEVYPIYLPFWYSNIRVMGWICGYEERTYSDGKGHTRTERIPKEEMVLQEYRRSEIACDPGDLGIKFLRNMDGESSFEDFEMIPTYEATTSKDDSLDRMKAQALSDARRAANVPHVTFEKVHVMPRSLSMVYYPVWVVRYSYRDRMYIYTIDGVSGQVISGRAPGDPLFQGLAITIGTSVGGLIAAGGLIIASTGTENSAAFGIGGVIVGAIITFGAYLFFRHGSEIIEGDFSDKKYGLGGLGNIGKEIGNMVGGGF
ncbi:MAG: hypothetical protein A4E32_01454 [Methanomassiliicoccales archaeon PtaU1.Bin124]|nr:MAG: hypothetical protein A4E32_01454 [Methanomassiliicoccales archaeon PtaU1.Bin124]